MLMGRRRLALHDTGFRLKDSSHQRGRRWTEVVCAASNRGGDLDGEAADRRQGRMYNEAGT